jgi:asparaginyl-tRNA synthetase
MKKRTEIAQILRGGTALDSTVTVMGWVKNFRNSQFVALNDGSTLGTLQVVVSPESDPETLKRITVGAAVCFVGKVVASQGKGQTVEIIAESIEIFGDCDASVYPLQPKKHSLEFLREIAHLRFRTQTFSAIFRLRHSIAFAIHQFFNDKGFFYLHAPIITASDAEGAGEMFHVTTLDLKNPPLTEGGNEVDYSKDFFARPTNLTVSGQLEGELAALALSKIYTFGPTFRAENSNTSRHLAEFWMIEPEVAFADLEDNMDLAEAMLKYCIDYCLKNCREDLDFLATRLAEEDKQKPQAERSEMGLIEKLEFVSAQPFERLDYTAAVDILVNSSHNKKGKFKFPISWGTDLQSEHERFLVEKHFKKPVILINYPKDIKAFYMRQNDDGKTVAAMDILFPGIGEIVGGSQREERLEKLERRMEEMHIPTKEMSWFLDTRRYGTCPHAGYGLGFERLVLFISGMTNIRDVIPFPRYPGNAEF